MTKLERASFGSKLGVILATAGSAVGLGNIWRFPYMTGQNGGAIFIIIYVFCILLLGIPCMISEFIIGRHGQANTARAFRIMSGDTIWSLIGYMGVLTGFLISGYYAVVSGWCLEYVWASLSGKLLGNPDYIQSRLYPIVLRHVLAGSYQACILDVYHSAGHLYYYREWCTQRY